MSIPTPEIECGERHALTLMDVARESTPTGECWSKVSLNQIKLRLSSVRTLYLLIAILANHNHSAIPSHLNATLNLTSTYGPAGKLLKTISTETLLLKL
jgi:hypothetical protein